MIVDLFKERRDLERNYLHLCSGFIAMVALDVTFSFLIFLVTVLYQASMPIWYYLLVAAILVPCVWVTFRFYRSRMTLHDQLVKLDELLLSIDDADVRRELKIKILGEEYNGIEERENSQERESSA